MRGLKMKVTDEQLVAALLQHGTIQATASALNVAPRTIYDRMRSYDFRILYDETRTDILRNAATAFEAKLSDAIETISEIMKDKDAPHSSRLQASLAIIQCAEKFVDRLRTDEAEVRKLRSDASLSKALGDIGL